MKMEMSQTENKSDVEVHELSFTFCCFYFMNI